MGVFWRRINGMSIEHVWLESLAIWHNGVCGTIWNPQTQVSHIKSPDHRSHVCFVGPNELAMVSGLALRSQVFVNGIACFAPHMQNLFSKHVCLGPPRRNIFLPNLLRRNSAETIFKHVPNIVQTFSYFLFCFSFACSHNSSSLTQKDQHVR